MSKKHNKPQYVNNAGNQNREEVRPTITFENPTKEEIPQMIPVEPNVSNLIAESHDVKLAKETPVENSSPCSITKENIGLGDVGESDIKSEPVISKGLINPVMVEAVPPKALKDMNLLAKEIDAAREHMRENGINPADFDLNSGLPSRFEYGTPLVLTNEPEFIKETYHQHTVDAQHRGCPVGDKGPDGYVTDIMELPKYCIRILSDYRRKKNFVDTQLAKIGISYRQKVERDGGLFIIGFQSKGDLIRIKKKIIAAGLRCSECIKAD